MKYPRSYMALGGNIKGLKNQMIVKDNHDLVSSSALPQNVSVTMIIKGLCLRASPQFTPG